MIRMEVIGDKKVVVQFQALPLKIFRAARGEFLSILNDMRNFVIDKMTSTPRDTSKSYTYGRTAPHHPSMPGGFPARDSGDLIGSLVLDERPNESEMGSNITQSETGGEPYPVLLEKGTKKMKARPWLKPTVEEFDDTIERRVKNAIMRGIG